MFQNFHITLIVSYSAGSPHTWVTFFFHPKSNANISTEFLFSNERMSRKKQEPLQWRFFRRTTKNSIQNGSNSTALLVNLHSFLDSSIKMQCSNTIQHGFSCGIDAATHKHDVLFGNFPYSVAVILFLYSVLIESIHIWLFVLSLANQELRWL